MDASKFFPFIGQEKRKAWCHFPVEKKSDPWDSIMNELPETKDDYDHFF